MSTQETRAAESVDPEYEDIMGKAGDTYAPPVVCGARPPRDGEDCRLPEGHDGEHSDLWAVWPR